LSDQQQQQLRDLARALGADPDFLIRYLENVQITDRGEGTPGFASGISYSTDEESRAADLAQHLLGVAFREGREADFSPETMAEAVVAYERMRGETRTYMGEMTTLGLEREARRMGVNPMTLTNAVRTYCMFAETNPELADHALEVASGGDARIAMMARAYHSRIQITAQVNGRVEFWIRRSDKRAILAQYNSDRLQHARLARMSRGERAVYDHVERWGGDYNRVMRNVRTLLRGRDVRARGAEQERDVEIAQSIVETLRDTDLSLRDLRNFEDLEMGTRGDFIASLGLSYRPERPVEVPVSDREEIRRVAFESTIEIGDRTFAVRYTPTEEEEERFGGTVAATTVRRGVLEALTSGRITGVREVTGDREFERGDEVSTAYFRDLMSGRWAVARATNRRRVREAVA
jgi:hypothetical protein